MQRQHLLKVGVSGIRGVVGQFFTPSLACAFAQAFGTYVGRGRVVVGRDSRASGEMLQHAVTCGLLAVGCDVVELGVLPTPTIQMYAGSIGARGGIAVTASHNPPEYNALKLFNARGLFFNRYEREELVDLYHQSDFRHSRNEEIGCVVSERAAPAKLHIERVLRHVDAERIRRRKFRVALDAVNGAGSVMTPAFLRETLGCELQAISVDPALPFPRVAEPRPDTLGDLAALVTITASEIGFAQDPDGDRLAVVDETGRVLDNDDMLALVMEAALPRVSGDIVVNLSTSCVIDDIAARHGRRVYRTPVGEANVVDVMQAVGAAIGGEGSSGGVIYPAVHLCRDSYTGMAFLLDRMADTGQSISALAARLPRYFRRLGQLSFEGRRLGQLTPLLEESYPGAGIDRSDGVKLAFPDRWIHVRPSNTEPFVRIAAEARSEEALEELYSGVLRLFDTL
jgi:phosphomannomutase